ncbi:WG repeat-containing protein [uncultured Croceitalea sp.]|uniref:WG repeat-containing protein n=1 Tax=uncultured Croceitalea sp. TaxID=1798908 RepID=UPI00374E50AC
MNIIKAKLYFFIFNSLIFLITAYSQETKPITEYAPEVEIDYGEIRTKNGKYGVAKGDGTILVPFEYDSLLYNELARLYIAKKKGKTGGINQNNDIIIQFKYEDIQSFETYVYGFLKTKHKNKYGVVNYKGKEIIKNKFDSIKWHEEGFFITETGNKIGAIDENGNYILHPVSCDEIQSKVRLNSIDKYFIFKSNNKYGVVDYKGKIVIQPKYLTLFFWSRENFFYVKNELHKIGIIDIKENVLVPLDYDVLRFDERDLIVIKKNGKYGAIDIENNEILPLEYDDLYSFSTNSSNRLIATKNNKKALINKKGSLLTKIKYDRIHPINDGILSTFLNEKYGLMDENGNIILNNKYENVNLTYGDRIIATQDSASRLFDTQGNLLTNQSYEKIEFINSLLYFAVKKEGKYGLINFNGELIIQSIYDKIFNKKYSYEKGIYGKKNGRKEKINVIE